MEENLYLYRITDLNTNKEYYLTIDEENHRNRSKEAIKDIVTKQTKISDYKTEYLGFYDEELCEKVGVKYKVKDYTPKWMKRLMCAGLAITSLFVGYLIYGIISLKIDNDKAIEEVNQLMLPNREDDLLAYIKACDLNLYERVVDGRLQQLISSLEMSGWTYVGKYDPKLIDPIFLCSYINSESNELEYMYLDFIQISDPTKVLGPTAEYIGNNGPSILENYGIVIDGTDCPLTAVENAKLSLKN